MSDKTTVYIGDESVAAVAQLLIECEAWFEMTPLKQGRVVEVQTDAVLAHMLRDYVLEDDDFRQIIVRGTIGSRTPYVSLQPGEDSAVSDNGAVLLLRCGPDGDPAVYLSRGCIAGPRLLKALQRVLKHFTDTNSSTPLNPNELRSIVEAIRDSG